MCFNLLYVENDHDDDLYVVLDLDDDIDLDPDYDLDDGGPHVLQLAVG